VRSKGSLLERDALSGGGIRRRRNQWVTGMPVGRSSGLNLRFAFEGEKGEFSAEETCPIGAGAAVLRPSMSDVREALESISEAQCSEHPGFCAAVACTSCGTFICASSRACPCLRCLHATPELATRRARLAASLVDGAALLLPPFLLGLALPGQAVMKAPAAYVPALLLLLVQAGLIRGTGASLGKRLLGIRVVRGDGRPAEVWRIALLRNALPSALCSYCGWLGLVDALFIAGEERRCLHDWVAGTRVVKVPQAQRSCAARLVTG